MSAFSRSRLGVVAVYCLHPGRIREQWSFDPPPSWWEPDWVSGDRAQQLRGGPCLRYFLRIPEAGWEPEEFCHLVVLGRNHPARAAQPQEERA